MADVNRQDVRLFAHDVRGLLSCVQLEIDGLAASDDDLTRLRAVALQRATDRLLDYCKNALRDDEAGDDTTLLRLSEVITDAASFITLEAAYHGIDVDYTGDCSILTQREAIAVHRIVMNLGRNAVAAMRLRGFGRFAIVSKRMPDLLKIDFIDNGSGLPDAVLDCLLPRLGQPYPAHGRVGLGLPSTKRMTAKLGGDLLLLRSSPRGTAFRVVIPIKTAGEDRTFLTKTLRYVRSPANSETWY